jgi:hypothetical protein
MRDVAPVVRIYEAQTLCFPAGAASMPAAIANLPPCLLCKTYSHLPPAKQLYLKVGEDAGIGVVCQECAADHTDQELEAKVSGSLDPPLAALDWVEKAAKAWSAPASEA